MGTVASTYHMHVLTMKITYIQPPHPDSLSSMYVLPSMDEIFQPFAKSDPELKKLSELIKPR